ncbi:MAG: chloramphenicol phosphotransferase CPT family protein [Actinomycetota bacterium]|nr:chloramphenicol phosphotransferase CPT family protein [Actinomycetota bacterium]
MNEIDWSAVRDAELDPPCIIVRLVCSLPVLVRREHIRGTTHPGTAADTFARELGAAGYDLTVDTEGETPEAAAATVEGEARRLRLEISSA